MATMGGASSREKGKAPWGAGVCENRMNRVRGARML